MNNLDRITQREIFLLKIALLTFLLVVAGEIFGQSGIPNGSCGIAYTYDAAGNMVKREYLCNNSGRIMSSMATNMDMATQKVPKGAGDAQTFHVVTTLYPNPTTGRFVVHMAKSLDKASVELVNVQGSVVSKFIMSGTLLHFDLSEKPSGLYFIKIYDKGMVLTAKVSKQ